MDTDSTENHLMFFALYIFIGVFGIVGNYLTFKVFWQERRRSVFHLQLAVANIITLICTFFSAFSALKGSWAFGDTICQFFGFQVFLAGFVELSLTSLICVETYMTVCTANKEQELSKPILSLVSILVWVYACLFSVAPLFGWNTYTREPIATSCGIDLENNTPVFYSYLFITHALFLLMIAPAVTCLVLTLLRKPNGSKAFSPLFTDKELVKISFLLFTVIGLGCLPFYLRVLSYLRGTQPVLSSFLALEFSHLAMKAICLLQPVAYMCVSNKFRNYVLSYVTGVDLVNKKE